MIFDLPLLTVILVVLEFKERRGVAQLARVLAWGARGRLFKSGHSDHFFYTGLVEGKAYVLFKMWSTIL